MTTKISFFFGSLGLLAVGFAAFVGLGSADYQSQTTIKTSGMTFHMPRMTKLSHLSDAEAVMTYQGVTGTISHINTRCLNGFEGCVLKDSHQRNVSQSLSVPRYRTARAQYKHTIQGNYDLQTATMTILIDTASHSGSAGKVVSRYYVVDPGKGLYVVEVTGNTFQQNTVLELAYILQQSFRILPVGDEEIIVDTEVLSDEVLAVITALENPETDTIETPVTEAPETNTPEELEVSETVALTEENTE